MKNENKRLLVAAGWPDIKKTCRREKSDVSDWKVYKNFTWMMRVYLLPNSNGNQLGGPRDLSNDLRYIEGEDGHTQRRVERRDACLVPLNIFLSIFQPKSTRRPSHQNGSHTTVR